MHMMSTGHLTGACLVPVVGRVTTFDGGPADMFRESFLHNPRIPEDVNPASPKRNVLFLHHNGFGCAYENDCASHSKHGCVLLKLHM